MSDADVNEPASNPYLAQLEEQIRRKGIKPFTSIHDLACDVFESDEELDEFLADLSAFRHSDMA
ncbi:MAG TPA: hypothetical protein VGM75_28875 [Pseudonocardiaceae bacterium]